MTLPTTLRPRLRTLDLAWQVVSAVLAMLLAGCGGGGGGGSASTPAAVSAAASLSPAAELGQFIFHDASLSGSGRMACASCHDPARGHASPFDTPVAFGGPGLDRPGLRNPPAIRYLRFNGAFQLAADGSASGGFFWDGRADSLQAQARGPFLNASEMANASVADVVAKLAAAPYAQRFRAVFGDTILADPEAAFDRMTFALQRYQLEDADFAPFTSKFDAVTAGRDSFTPQELNGLALFNRPDKGNCAACHPSTKPANAPAALFTDFSYDSLGLPRNAAIPANADAAYNDLGVCGRAALTSRTSLCGVFKVPSLRNVALRKRLFHNGVFGSLEQAIRFYVRRDTDPSLWYPLDTLGNPLVYDDLPSTLRGNVNTTEGPYNRAPGQAPALSDAEIGDLAAFLRTLTDGHFTP